jgi:hypothetical protein
MPITVIWDNAEKTTIRYIIEGDWTWDEMNQAIATSNVMLDGVDRKIDFIHDLLHSTKMPNGILTQLRNLIGKEHPNTGNSVLVSPQKSTTMLFAKSLLNMIHKIYKQNWIFEFTDTLEDARQMLANHVTTNDPL